ncbi:hypothetical protein Tco_0583547 [Tanacetum coccineum]
MRSDELYKFSDGTLQSVRDTLHDMMESLRQDAVSHSCDEVLKLKNFKKDENTRFQEQEKYEHVGLKVTSTEDGKRSQDDDNRLCLADDLKEAQVYM